MRVLLALKGSLPDGVDAAKVIEAAKAALDGSYAVEIRGDFSTTTFRPTACYSAGLSGAEPAVNEVLFLGSSTTQIDLSLEISVDELPHLGRPWTWSQERAELLCIAADNTACLFILDREGDQIEGPGGRHWDELIHMLRDRWAKAF